MERICPEIYQDSIDPVPSYPLWVKQVVTWIMEADHREGNLTNVGSPGSSQRIWSFLLQSALTEGSKDTQIPLNKRIHLCTFMCKSIDCKDLKSTLLRQTKQTSWMSCDQKASVCDFDPCMFVRLLDFVLLLNLTNARCMVDRSCGHTMVSKGHPTGKNTIKSQIKRELLLLRCTAPLVGCLGGSAFGEEMLFESTNNETKKNLCSFQESEIFMEQ